MNVETLKAMLDDPAVKDDLPVIVKWDEGPWTRIMDVAAATKQGESFRIYPDPKSEKVTEPRGPLPPAEVQAAYDVAEAKLRDALLMVTDHMGMGFQDYPWWAEACDLARALKERSS